MTKWPNAAIIAIFLATMIAVTGCAQRPAPVRDTSEPRGGITEYLEGAVWVYQDPDTGCEYLVTSKGGITPRMKDTGGRNSFPNPQMGCQFELSTE